MTEVSIGFVYLRILMKKNCHGERQDRQVLQIFYNIFCLYVYDSRLPIHDAIICFFENRQKAPFIYRKTVDTS